MKNLSFEHGQGGPPFIPHRLQRLWLVGWVENIKITISSKHIVVMVLLYIYRIGIWRKLFKFQIFSWVLRHLKIWNTLTKVKNQVVWKYPMWVFKTTAFEPRSQQSNLEKDPRSPYREIVQKLFKFGHYVWVYRFEQFLDNFSVWGPWIFFWIVIVVQMWSFWIPTLGTFEQLEISLFLTYFKFSNGEAPS